MTATDSRPATRHPALPVPDLSDDGLASITGEIVRYAAEYDRTGRADFREFTRTRVPTSLGKPIAETERIQTVAGEIDLQIATADRSLYGSLLRTKNADQSILPQRSVIKAGIGRSVVAATQAAVAALGNPGLTRPNGLERHLRNALCVRVHPPQDDAALLTAGRRVLAGTQELRSV